MNKNITPDLRYLSNMIFDIDGVIWVDGSPNQGAIDLINDLEDEGANLCFLTNDCSVSKFERHTNLTLSGFTIDIDQIITATDATRTWLKKNSVKSIMYLGVPSLKSELADGLITSDRTNVDAVVIGDIFKSYDRSELNNAAEAVISGAHFVAMQKNRRWWDGSRWYIDNGFWVSGLEYVTDREAHVTGKPSNIAYITALNRLGLNESDYPNTIFVSDDIHSDLKGAKDLGLITIYLGINTDLPIWIDYYARDITTLSQFLQDKAS